MSHQKTKLVLNRIGIYFLFSFMTIVASSCDPEYNYNFNGTIAMDGKALNNLSIQYHFLPEEKAQNWRANIEDSIALTNHNGEFLITQSTISVKFDSLKIKISKEGYEEYELISHSEVWSTSFGLNKLDIENTFDQINLVKIDSLKSCEFGKFMARNESKKMKLTHHEFFRVGTRDLKYWNKFEKALNEKGVTLKTVPMFQYTFPSNKFYQNECYINETKKVLDEKFGAEWLEQIKKSASKKE